jgi:hypothetical protein
MHEGGAGCNAAGTDFKSNRSKDPAKVSKRARLDQHEDVTCRVEEVTDRGNRIGRVPDCILQYNASALSVRDYFNRIVLTIQLCSYLDRPFYPFLEGSK